MAAPRPAAGQHGTPVLGFQIPADLLERAQKSSGTGITQTVRAGLQLLAAAQAYEDLRKMRGTYRFSRSLAEIKEDR